MGPYIYAVVSIAWYILLLLVYCYLLPCRKAVSNCGVTKVFLVFGFSSHFSCKTNSISFFYSSGWEKKCFSLKSFLFLSKCSWEDISVNSHIWLLLHIFVHHVEFEQPHIDLFWWICFSLLLFFCHAPFCYVWLNLICDWFHFFC
jgi:hypothetical protein